MVAMWLNHLQFTVGTEKLSPAQEPDLEKHSKTQGQEKTIAPS